MINMVMIMRNFTKKAIKCAKAAAATAAFAFCMTKTAEVSQAVSGAVERCIGVVIPSLFAMMIVSGLLVRSGITGAVPRFIGMISEKLLGMEGFMLPVFTFGMFAGYPVGAKMICTEVQCGRLDKNRAALLCVLVSFALSGLFAVLPVVKALSDGMRTILLTIVIASAAALLFPVADEEEGKADEQ